MAEQVIDKDWYIIHRKAKLKSPERREILERELEDAFEKQYHIIVVEPRFLGDEVMRWITFGNFLHKSSVVISITTLTLLPLLPPHMFFFVPVPLGVFGIGGATLYNISWQYDPCCKYQVDWKGKELRRIPSEELTVSSPVVLVRHNDIFRKILHTSLALTVCGFIGWKWYNR